MSLLEKKYLIHLVHIYIYIHTHLYNLVSYTIKTTSWIMCRPLLSNENLHGHKTSGAARSLDCCRFSVGFELGSIWIESLDWDPLRGGTTLTWSLQVSVVPNWVQSPLWVVFCVSWYAHEHFLWKNAAIGERHYHVAGCLVCRSI